MFQAASPYGTRRGWARLPWETSKQLVVLLIAAAVVAVIARWIRLPYTLALLLLGLGLGALPFISAPTLNSEIILLLFLPPLLFEAAFVLDLRLLWSVRTGVFVFAVPGVLLAMVVGGVLVHWALGLPWSVALLFGAMIAATDPVAVLATFRQLGADPRLATLLEGESLLNDGIALALLTTLAMAVEGRFSPGPAIGTFVVSVVGGAAVGLGLGWVGHLLIAAIDEHLTEMTVSVAMAYGAFLAAETLHLSGVLATVSAAMMLGLPRAGSRLDLQRRFGAIAHRSVGVPRLRRQRRVVSIDGLDGSGRRIDAVSEAPW